jgi:2-polyprenyl-6-hydroxyphenyl methylase/3-demethylubiquinone-9 3-methyltransferase
MSYNFEICKNCSAHAGYIKYRLNGKTSRNANVWACKECGSHYIDYLDPIERIEQTIEPLNLDVLVKVQHYDFQDRHAKHIDLIQQLREIKGLSVLDIGCGGGMFLSLLKQKGADVCGLELSESALLYARSCGLTVHNYPIEHEFWQSQYTQKFDIVTMWDVIEHVNFPYDMLKAAASLLKSGGLICISTPSRDGFYYRLGALTYKLSMGKFPTFLNVIYSNHLFGHKQMLSTRELKQLFDRVGIKPLLQKKIHELSLPYRNYLKKFFLPDILVDVLCPFVALFFKTFRIHNKIIAIGQKCAVTDRQIA